MDLAPRLHLMNWLVSQGLTGLPENDLVRGFCERCRAQGLDLSRALVFIDTLHPIFEGRGFRWNDTETNESDTFGIWIDQRRRRRAELAPLHLLSHARTRS
jgi:adenylate cyclase